MKKILAVLLCLMLSLTACAETVLTGEIQLPEDLFSLLSADKPLIRLVSSYGDAGVFAHRNDEGDLEVRLESMTDNLMQVEIDEYVAFIYDVDFGFSFSEFESDYTAVSFELLDNSGGISKVHPGCDEDGNDVLLLGDGSVYTPLEDGFRARAKSASVTIDGEFIEEIIAQATGAAQLLTQIRPSEANFYAMYNALAELGAGLSRAGLDFDVKKDDGGSWYSLSFDPARLQLELIDFIDGLFADSAALDSILAQYAPMAAQLFGDPAVDFDPVTGEYIMLSGITAEALQRRWMSVSRELGDFYDIPTVDVQLWIGDDGWTLDAFLSVEEGDSCMMLTLDGAADGAFDGTLQIYDDWYEELYVIDAEGCIGASRSRLVLRPRQAMEGFTGLIVNCFGGSEPSVSIATDGVSLRGSFTGGQIHASASLYSSSIFDMKVYPEAHAFEVSFADYWDYAKIALEDGTLVIYQ